MASRESGGYHTVFTAMKKGFATRLAVNFFSSEWQAPWIEPAMEDPFCPIGVEIAKENLVFCVILEITYMPGWRV